MKNSNVSPTGRLTTPSPNYQRMRPSLTQAQREVVSRLREALKESLPDFEEKPDPAPLEARILAAMSQQSGKMHSTFAFVSDVHLASFRQR